MQPDTRSDEKQEEAGKAMDTSADSKGGEALAQEAAEGAVAGEAVPGGALPREAAAREAVTTASNPGEAIKLSSAVDGDATEGWAPDGWEKPDPPIVEPPCCPRQPADLLEERSSMPKRRSMLLDLPLDILKAIFAEITNSNDLTALALTHTVLYHLAIPNIYARFDIVWPDTQVLIEPRMGVDALTHGLSTLVKSSAVYGEEAANTSWYGEPCRDTCCGHCGKPMRHQPCHTRDHLGFAAPVCTRCGHSTTISKERTANTRAGAAMARRRNGNNYAAFTRKFSLGNGPMEWVQEYLTTKESGKMLGTLVALALARMRNLETFIWDMPTGILRDVWLALEASQLPISSKQPSLEKIWIRWHKNRELSVLNRGFGANVVESHGVRSLVFLSESYLATEQPSFTVLPALKSITVLEIDEIAYLAELAYLIERSVDRLRELRIGAASLAHANLWRKIGEISLAEKTEDEFLATAAMGGLLGLLMANIYDCGAKLVFAQFAKGEGVNTSVGPHAVGAMTPAPATAMDSESEHDVAMGKSGNAASTAKNQPTKTARSSGLTAPTEPPPKHAKDARGPSTRAARPTRKKLRLEVLEVEKIYLSLLVLCKTIDFSVLTSLTLLNCEGDEALWKSLRHRFAPQGSRVLGASGSHGETTGAHKPLTASIPGITDYALRLKRVHTNNVSPALMAFFRDALAPNTLEWLFLQDRATQPSKVSIDAIYRGPLRRHRASLKKVLIDSGTRRVGGPRDHRWKKWTLNREILSFFVSGKLSSLRELCVSLEHKDWHFFLQRLPQVPHIRSLYIPHISSSSHACHLDAKEFGLQILDIVTLRPEIELCYLGILAKCFEVLENKPTDETFYSFRDTTSSHVDSPAVVGGDDTDDETDGSEWPDEHDDDDEDDDEDDEDDDAHASVHQAPPAVPTAATATTEDHDSDDGVDDTIHSEASSDDGSGARGATKKAKLKLREILFYDDKVSVFKARHGKL